MITFDIPYSPANGKWAVQVSNDGHPAFKTRIDAIRFAVDRALKAQQHGDDALITIEGVDGLRRSFDHEVKGVA